MNEFMEVFNEYGWHVFYFAGFVTGCIISIFAFLLGSIADAICGLIKEKKHGKEKKI